MLKKVVLGASVAVVGAVGYHMIKRTTKEIENFKEQCSQQVDQIRTIANSYGTTNVVDACNDAATNDYETRKYIKLTDPDARKKLGEVIGDPNTTLMFGEQDGIVVCHQK